MRRLEAVLTFFSVSLSHLLTLQIWWLFSFLQGAQSPQLSFLWQPWHSPHLFLFFLVGFSCVSAWWPPERLLWLRLLRPGEPLLLMSAGGLKASARPVMVSGVGSVEEMAATWPGVSASPGSDSDLSDLTELSDSDPSSEAVLTLPLAVSPEIMLSVILR